MEPTRPGGLPAVRIDVDNEWAWCGDRRLDLAPRVFALLRHLAERPGRLITKRELFTALWGDTVVSEAALTSCVRDLRKALRDASRTPRYVETVHRRGFRFIGPVVTSPAVAPREAVAADRPVATPSPTFVGRDAELARLHGLFAVAAGGERRVVFVTGEAGIGKTALVEAFLSQVRHHAGVRIARGQCVEQYGAGEPYLPVLEALGRLGRQPDGDALVRILRQYAPTWLAQLPALLTDDALEAVQRRAQTATRERMLRELIEALDAVSGAAPLVVVLEDLHWSDSATIELVAMLARRPDPARLLVLGTYRPGEVAGIHPLGSVKLELHSHGRCEELALGSLGEEVVAQYLAGRFPGASIGPELVRRLRENTGGNPLFLVNVVDHLVAQGHLRHMDGEWKLVVPPDRAVSGVPVTLWEMIEKQVERLAPEEQAVLTVGSVAGADFSAALGAADGIDVHESERRCADLARRGQFVRAMGLCESPDGTVAGRYGFVHAMYRNVLYQRIPIGHRVGLHLRIGARLEQAHGARAGEIAGELAMHFEEGRDAERSVRYRRLAADEALRRHAYREAVDHARGALARLAALPPSRARDRQELAVQTVLGAAVIATNGWADPDVAGAYARARELCAEREGAPELFPVLLGLHGFYLMRGDLRIAQETAEQLSALADATDDAAIVLAANNTAGLTAFYRGEFVAALARFERAARLADPERRTGSPLRTFSVDHDPGVSCAAHTAWALTLLGHHDRAAACMERGLAHARAIHHPLSLAMAYNFASTFYQYRRQTDVVRELEDVRLEYAATYDFDLFRMLGEVYRGWLLVEDGRREEGAARIEQGLLVYQAVGAELGRPTFLGILADVRDALGRPEDGLSALAEAIELAGRTGLHYWDAELRRLKGLLTLHAGTTSGGRGRGPAERDAESLFLDAIEIARRQEAKSLELRATMDVSRLWRRQGKRRQAHDVLATAYGWFTEGFDAPDLVDAREMLEALDGRG